jgi:hypothetical protein
VIEPVKQFVELINAHRAVLRAQLKRQAAKV